MMQIPSLSENALTFQRLARALGVNVATVCRWRTRGVLNRDTGERHKLHAVRVGGVWRVSTKDAEAFIRALNGEPANAKSDPSRSAAADAELQRLGA